MGRSFIHVSGLPHALAPLPTLCYTKTMPVRKVGKDCYQWGRHGKVYCGKGVKAKATKQGQAAYAAGYREPKKPARRRKARKK